ncbi:MAG: beta-phosphoglucomutase [Bacteroidota bacterium]
MQFKACIFDLDGVLTDTALFHFNAWQRLAGELGVEFSKEDNEALKGVSRMRSLEIILSAGGVQKTDEEKQELASKKNQWFVEDVKKMTPADILPGVKEFLDQLKSDNIKIGLASSSKNAPTIIQKLGIADYFEAKMDGNSVAKAKPDPEIFLKCASELGIEPKECVVFEDAVAGVEAAIAGGMSCVGIGQQDILGDADHVMPGFENFTIDKLKQL